MIGVYTVEQCLHHHKSCSAARGCSIVGQCSGGLWTYCLPQAYGFSAHRWLLPLKSFKELYRWLFAISLSSPFHTHRHRLSHLTSGAVGVETLCTWLHRHSVFLSRESCFLFSAVTAERWGTCNYYATLWSATQLCCQNVRRSLRPCHADSVR